MAKDKQYLLAIGGAAVLAFITDSYPQIGGALLVLIVLGMLLTAQRKGYINANV